jgi:hypothetical protein
MLAVFSALAVFAQGSCIGTLYLVTTTADSGPGSLRQAILDANSDTCATDANGIIFDSSVKPTITLSSGVLEISHSLNIMGPGQSNLAISGGGTVEVFHIDSGATVQISGVTIENGGGVFVSGGIRNDGTLTLLGSTLSGNSNIPNGAGGIWNTGILTVEGCTLSGNSNFSTVGGILNNGGTVTITDSTLSGNSGGILSEGASHTVTVKNSIVANSLPGGNCSAVSSGTITSQDYNLTDDVSCFFSQIHDLNTPTGLDPSGLQSNPGPPVPTLGVPQTIALLPTSSALDVIPISSCTDVNGNPVTTDERGWSRPQGTNCDIGAFEGVAFSSISAKLTITALSPAIYSFDLSARFTPGATIDPLTEPVTLQVGSYFVTIPVGSFHEITKGSKAGTYVYSGIIGGVTLSIQISPPSVTGDGWNFKATGYPVNLPGLSNPVTVTISIGDDQGSAAVTAKIL